jgi:hypothetical protein
VQAVVYDYEDDAMSIMNARPPDMIPAKCRPHVVCHSIHDQYSDRHNSKSSSPDPGEHTTQCLRTCHGYLRNIYINY